MSSHAPGYRRMAGALAGEIASLALGGCTLLSGPQAWEKGNLAKPAMGMGGDPLEMRYSQHITASKEAASGGYGVGGGGCGCN